MLNLITLERSPTVWRDEVMFTEPAVRFLQGHGFTATSWEAPSRLPAVLNGPLYSLLLIPWLKLWGIGPVAARSLGLVLGGLATWGLWLLARRERLLRSPTWRLAGVAVLLCGFSLAWVCRSGRYDALGMFLVVALAGSVGGGRKRGVLPAVLLPFAGLYLLPYVVLAALAGVALGGRSSWRQLVVPLGGLALGCGLLALLHLGLGTWSATAAFVGTQTGPSALGRVALIPAAFWADPSLVPLVVFLLYALLCGGPGRSESAASAGPLVAARWRRPGPAVLGLALAVGIPAWMTLAGKYAPYYGWMTAIPVLGCALCILEQRSSRGGAVGGPALAREAGVRSRWLVRAGIVALLAATAVGLPLRLLACALEWRQRDYAPVTQFVRTQVRPDDVVVSGFESFYAVARHCRQVTLPSCLRADGNGIPRETTALIGGSELLAELGAVEEQGWVPMASCVSPRYSLPFRVGQARWYGLTIWRRGAGSAAAHPRQAKAKATGVLFSAVLPHDVVQTR